MKEDKEESDTGGASVDKVEGGDVVWVVDSLFEGEKDFMGSGDGYWWDGRTVCG